MLRLGTVPYLNAMPLVDGLASAAGVRLVEDVPSRLAGRLRNGELDVALVSAVELFRAPSLTWFEGPAITSDGPVRSILLFLRTPLESARTVALDTSSLSASALTRVCLCRLLGLDEPRWLAAPPTADLDAVDADAVLRIGDPALATDPAGRAVLDLGEVWTEHTGLPFVYALWLARPAVPSRPLADQLLAARRRGLDRRDAIATDFARRHGMDEDVARRYLAESIGFDLGPREREGLALYGKLVHELGLVDTPTLPPPVARDAARTLRA